MSEPLPAIGQKVNARKDLISDLTEEGMGIEVCARRGEELVVRSIKDYGDAVFIRVSHEHITDRTFSVRPDEIDYAYPAADVVGAAAQSQEGGNV